MPGRILCLLLLLVSLARAQAEVVVVKIGGRALRIPTPEGFARYDGRSQSLDGFEASFAPASNRILAAYAEPTDLAAVRSGEFPQLSRSFSAQANWQFEEADLSSPEFTTVKAALREQLDALKNVAGPAIIDLEKSASSAVSQKLAANVSVSLGEVAPVGVFAETPESLCFLLVIKSRVAGASLSDPIEPSTTVAGCVAFVRERLIYLYATSAYDGKADGDWARAQIVTWRDALLAANAPDAPEGDDLPPEPMADDDLPWWRRKPAVLILVAAALAAWWLLRRKPLRLPE